MNYGDRLRESWSNALKNAQTQLRELLASSAAPSTSTSNSSSSPTTGTNNASVWRAVPVRSSTNTPTASLSSTPTTDVRARSTELVKGKSTATTPEPTDVIVHRRPSKDGDVYRAVLDVHIPPTTATSTASTESSKALLSLDAWKAVLATPELRSEYDPVVQAGRIVEMFDPETRIARTDFALGWPAK